MLRILLYPFLSFLLTWPLVGLTSHIQGGHIQISKVDGLEVTFRFIATMEWYADIFHRSLCR